MDALRIRRDVLRATVSGTMTVLDALLRSQAATALDRQNVLDLILHDQVSLHQLDAEIQANLTDDEFEADILNAIDYDERICALRTRVRFSASQDLSASPVPQPRAALFSTCNATSTLCSPPEEARPTVSTKVTGDMPPARAMTVARVEKHDDKEGAARYNDAKEDPEGLSPRERLLRPPYPGVSVIAVMEKSQEPCRDLAVADATIVSETSDRPCRSAGVANTALTSQTSLQPFRNPRFDDLTTALETSDPFCHGLSVDDATPVLENSELPCCDLYVGEVPLALVSPAVQQPGFESDMFSLGSATKTRCVQKMDSRQGITKRLLLRRSMSKLRRRKRASAALVKARWGGILVAKQNRCFYGDDPFFSKRSSIRDEPLYPVGNGESEVLWFPEITDRPMEHTYFLMEAVSDVEAMAKPSRYRDALWKFGSLHQLFPFDPGGCLATENQEHGLSFRLTI